MKVLLFNWNGVMDDVAVELRKQGHEVDLRGLDSGGWVDADILVFWNEIESQGWKALIQTARKAGKKTILIQHGRRGTSRIFPPFNEGLNCEFIMVWGEADKKRLMECGIAEERIFVTGCPLFNKLKPREPHKGKNVVFSLEHWTGEVPENQIVASQLRKLHGVNLITKGLEGESYTNIYDNLILSNRHKPGHFNVVAEVLSTADVVVAISESTFELFAESLNIPVVASTFWIPKAGGGDDRYKDYKRIYSDGCYQIDDFKKLPKAVKRALKKPDEMKEERRQAVIDDGGYDIENPIKRICEAILA